MVMKEKPGEGLKFEKIGGVVGVIYEDFDTTESIIKEKAVAFLLDTQKKGKVIVVYDKGAIKLGLIKVGEPLECLGFFSGTITAIDSKGTVVEEKMFLCMGIIGSAEIDEEEFARQGAVRLR